MHQPLRYFLVVLFTVSPFCRLAAAADPAGTLPPAADPILQSVDFDGVALEDAIAFLQDKFPQFKIAILRDPDVPAGFPKVTAKLKGVSLSQILDLIKVANPTVEIKDIDGPNGKIVCLLVHPPANAVVVGGGGGGSVFESNRNVLVVRVHRLTPMVEALSHGKNDPAARKEAMNQVLSLIKATLEQTGGEPPVLKVHEETQTLIFRGSGGQEASLASVLEALTPAAPTAEQLTAARERMTADVERARDIDKERFALRAQEMDQQMARLQKMLEQREKDNLDHAAEREQLKVRLEMTAAKGLQLEKELDLRQAELDKTRAEIKQQLYRADQMHDLVVAKAELQDNLNRANTQTARYKAEMEEARKELSDVAPAYNKMAAELTDLRKQLEAAKAANKTPDSPK